MKLETLFSDLTIFHSFVYIIQQLV